MLQYINIVVAMFSTAIQYSMASVNMGILQLQYIVYTVVFVVLML